MRVLLPVDSDVDRAIAAAKAVQTIPNAPETVDVIVLNIEKEVNVAGGDGGVVKSEDWYDEADFPASVMQAMEELEAVGISVEKRRKHGNPAAVIIEVAEDIDADRIIMAGRKQSPVGKVLFGSVTQSVLLNSSIPVTVIPE